MKSILTLAFALSAVGGAVVVACAEPEPTFAPPSSIVGRSLPGVPDEKAAASDGGPGGDFGAPYDPNANRPTRSMKGAHAEAGAPPAPTDCLTGGCHANVDPPNKAPPFAFGGQIFATVNPLVPAANADIVVIDGDAAKTRLGPVKSDEDGYFWLKAPITITDQARTKVRRGPNEVKMSSPLRRSEKSNDAACGRDSCHGSTVRVPIFLE